MTLRLRAHLPPGIAKIHAVNRKLIWNGPVLQGRFKDRAFAIRAFEEYNATVRRELATERLLVYEIGAGWQPICDFLEVAVRDGEFPHLNDRQEFWGRVRARLAGTAHSSHPS